MALKRVITKAVYDALSDVLKSEYKASGEEYLLDITGDEVPTLTRENATLKARAEKAETDLKTTSDEYTAYKASSNHKDIAALEKSYKDKETATIAAHNDRVSKLEGNLKRSYVDNVAESLAKSISTAPALLIPHIKARLAVDLEGDEPRTQVLDANGKLSASNIDDLKAEFVANKDYSAIMIGSKASGGAPKTNQQPGGFGGGKPADETTDFSKLSPKDLAAHLIAKKSEAQ